MYSAFDILAFKEAESSHPFMILLWIGSTGLIITTTLLWILRPCMTYSRHIVIILIFNAATSALGSTAFIIADKLIGPSDVAAIAYLLPIFSILFGCIFLRESVTFVQITWCCLSIIGVTFITQPEFLFQSKSDSSLHNPLGFVLAMANAMLMAATIVASRKLGECIHPLLSLLCMMLGILVISVIACSIGDYWTLPDSPINALRLFATVITFIIGFFLMFLGLCFESVKIVSILLTSEVIFARFGGILLVGVPWNWYALFGSIFIVVSCFGIALSVGVEGEMEENEEDRQIEQYVETGAKSSTESEHLISRKNIN